MLNKIFTKNELELRRLIYGQSKIIVLPKARNDLFLVKETLQAIEMVKDTMSIDGFIFRPNFAKKKKLTEYTDEDWLAMAAQYSLTYNWSDEFYKYTRTRAEDVLQEYFKDASKEEQDTLYTRPEQSDVKVVNEEYIKTLAFEIAESATVLREQQIRIINLLPIQYVEEAFNSANFTIKETEILFIKRLIQAGSKTFSFKDADQIVRFVVSNFAKESIEGQINKTKLKTVKLHIPTSFKKKILKDIDSMGKKTVSNTKNGIERTVKDMYKYHQFWKRLFKQLAYTSQAKMEKRFPFAMQIKTELYRAEIRPYNHKVEEYKKEGNYFDALREEMKNPGQMMRNILHYIRYPKGSHIAKKTVRTPNGFRVHKMFEGSEPAKIVKKDVSKLLSSDEFYETLLKVNTKLLWQTYTLLKDESIYETKTEKRMNGKLVQYSESYPLRGVDKDMAKLLKKKIKNVIKEKNRKKNQDIGNIYIDESAKMYPITFSDRDDTSISLSGEYLPKGSKIKISNILKDDEKYILRIGLAWRGKRSCDIDLAMNIEGYGSVYYGNPTLKLDEKVVVSSSGDITSCGNKVFSAELIDADIKAMKKHGFTTMYNAATMFSGTTFKDYECYWFMSIIPKEKRTVPERKIKIKLDDMDYATQITDDSKTMIGLKFDFKKDEILVMNIPLQHGNYRNASILNSEIDKKISEMENTTSVHKALKMSFNENQIVDDIEFADIIISKEEPVIDVDIESEEITKKPLWLHPGRDAINIKKLIY